MADIVQFDVDDISPTIAYSPFGDTFSTPNFSAGWNPLFNQTSLGGAPLPTGNSTSVHVTSLDGASLQVQWRGVGIQLVGTVSAAQVSVRIQLDGIPSSSNTTSDPQTLYAIDNLPNTNHNVTLTTSIGNQTPAFVVFEKAVIRAASPSNNNSTLTFTEQPLNDSLIDFLGRWDFNDTTSFHESQTPGDTARAMFIGTSFLIRGAVSPTGANYTVSLDNTVASLSARASFTKTDSVLFYASGLDPEVIHALELRNEDGGSLAFPVGGFSSFASGDPNPSQPSPQPSVNTISGLSSGTIAALALAGILAFILITGVLFYFLVYRPRRKRARQLRQQRLQPGSPIEDSEAVLDIGPYGNGNSPSRSPRSHKSSKKSAGSGFVAWKQQARGGNAKDLKNLGLIFRHSDSVKAKPGPSSPDEEWDDDDPRSAKSGFTIPSTVESSQSQRLGKGKGKGKKPSLWSLRSKKSSNSKSSTPSYNIDLPPLHKDGSGSNNTNGRARHSYFSEFTDISYMSTPTDPSAHQLSFSSPPNPPSKRPTPSPNHERTDSHGLLLLHGSSDYGHREMDSLASGPGPPPTIPSSTHRPEVFVQEVQSAYSDSLNLTHRSVPGLSLSTANTPAEQAVVHRDTDRGSVQTYDDALSVLGPATARAAIRGLSPRTSEVPSNTSMDMRLMEAMSSSHLASSGESHQREKLISDATVRPDTSGRFLDVRASSPFQIDFVGRRRDSQDPKRSARLSGGSRVRFDEQTAPSSVTDKDKQKGKAKADDPPSTSAPSKQTFRLTPQATPAPLSPPRSDADSSIQTSFLDFSGSSDPSITHSNDTSGSSRRFSAFSGHPQGPRSRWSSTTAPSSNAPGHQSSSGSNETHQSGASQVPVSPEQSPPSYHFPFPVSLPASPHHPEGYKPSPPTSPSAEQPVDNITPPSSAGMHSHPSGLSTNPVSPAESVPMSISDLHFQHSDSEDHDNGLPSNSSHLPPHPPLPSSVPPTPTRPQTEAAATSPQTAEVVVTPTTRIMFGPRSPSTPTPNRMGTGPRDPPR